MNGIRLDITIEQLNNRKKEGSMLTAISFEKSKNWDRMILCKCHCGKSKIIRMWAFINSTKSCGCFSFKRPHKRSKYPLHLRKVFGAIMRRCYIKKDISYKNYGAIGVIMCNEWKNNPIDFYDWAIANGWKKGLQIDKDITYKKKFNTDIGMVYSPEFCMLVTPKQNSNARRNNILIHFEGSNKTISEISAITGIKHTTLAERYYNQGKITLQNGKLY